MFDPKQLDTFPSSPGVYLMKSEKGAVLYVGKAKNLKSRLKQYFARTDERVMVPFLTSQVAKIETLVVPSEKEALLLENTLIKRHQPKYNALLKDDKTFISLMINHRHPWPMIRLIRCKGRPKEDALYFGPYTNAFAAKQTLELLLRLFPLRQCSDEELKRRTRPCLLYGIKRCIAPCVNKCSKEEYDLFVQGAIRFLKGQDKEILSELRASMEKASEALEFEKAAALLQTIRQIEHVTQSKALVVQRAGKDCDVLALHRQAHELVLVQLFFREGNLIGSEHYTFSDVVQEDDELLTSFLLQHYKNKEQLPEEILLPFSLPAGDLITEILKTPLITPHKGAKHALIEMAQINAKAIFSQEKNQEELREKRLLDLEETLGLTRYPKRIACFDISHIAGGDSVGSMVAFQDGRYDSKSTRLFRIKEAAPGDDYGAMREVLTRHLMRAKEKEALPDLLVVDGGKGQLHVAIEVFKELDIASCDLFALAKEAGRHDKGSTAEQIFLPHHAEPIRLPPHSPLLFLLQQIRDEAHRVAIGFHRKRREKRTIRSALDDIPGIGPIKRKRLLTHFGSLQRIQAASDEELQKIPGITRKDIASLRKP